MANKVGGLYFSLSANAAKLYAELDKSKKSIGKFAKQSRKQINQAGKAFGVMGVAASGATAVIVKSQLDAIDALAKTADKLGVTTEGLAGLRFAAEQTGVASNQLDMGLQRMTRRIAEAAKGTGEAKAALAELGLDAQKLSALPLDRQFQEIAGAMSTVESQSDKIRLGFKLFDSEGVNLINTLKVGKDGLVDFAAEAERLGIAVSRTDAAKIEAANNAISRAGSAIEGVGNRITVALAPYIEVIANQFAVAASSGVNMGEVVSDAMETIGKSVAFVADAYNGIVVVMQLIKATVLTVAQTSAIAYAAIAEGVNSVTGTMLESIEAVLRQGARLPSKLGGDLFREAAGSVQSVRDGMEQTVASIQASADALGESAANARQGFVDALNAPPPGDAILAKFKEIEIAATAAGAQIAAVASANVSTETGEATAVLDNDAFRAQLDERLRLQLEQTQAAADAELAIEQALQAQKLEGQVLTDQALLEMARQQAAAKVLAEFEAEQAAKGELGLEATDQQKLEMQKAIGDESVRIAAEIAKKRAKIAADEAKELAKFDLTTFKGKANTLKATLGLAAGFNKKSEKLQQAALIANKAIAIKDSIIAITGGIAKALNNPYPANLAFAASVAAQGAGLMSTLSSISGGGGGGGASFGGDYSAPSYAGNVAESPEVRQRQEQSGVTLIIQGDVNGVDSYLEEKMLPAIQEAVNERDLVFIDADSRQGQELAGAN